MKNITVKINKRNLTGLINKTSFNYGGMFISYGFIAIEFDTTKNNTAIFYENIQASSNSWTNYPGYKIWDNSGRKKWKKSEVLEIVESRINNVVYELNMKYPNVSFELVGW